MSSGTLPINLPNGYILVYGWGDKESHSGIRPSDTNVRFSDVYQVWSGGNVFVYAGDNVMWKEGSEYVKLTYNNLPYTQLPARLVTKQDIVL